MIFNNKEFKEIPFNKNYYVSKDGDIYSKYGNRLLRPMYRGRENKRYLSVDISIKGKQNHIPIHRLVYYTWVRPIDSNTQINHKDDNIENNSLDNLYEGTQIENVRDCVENNHRCGDIKELIIYDIEKKKILRFCPSSDFIDYCGHPSKSGSIKKFFNKNWFNKRYKVIKYQNVADHMNIKRRD